MSSRFGGRVVAVEGMWFAGSDPDEVRARAKDALLGKWEQKPSAVRSRRIQELADKKRTVGLTDADWEEARQLRAAHQARVSDPPPRRTWLERWDDARWPR